MPRTATALVLACLAALPAGCGASDPGRQGPNPNDKRAAALDCLTRGKGLPARSVGQDLIQVDGAGSGPRVQFFLTGGEAEAKQFEGGAEGSEQLGNALLFTRGGSEGVLKKVEDCLNQL